MANYIQRYTSILGSREALVYWRYSSEFPGTLRTISLTQAENNDYYELFCRSTGRWIIGNGETASLSLKLPEFLFLVSYGGEGPVAGRYICEAGNCTWLSKHEDHEWTGQLPIGEYQGQYLHTHGDWVDSFDEAAKGMYLLQAEAQRTSRVGPNREPFEFKCKPDLSLLWYADKI